MFIRDHKGHIVNIDEPKFTNDKELYLHLWFAQYNIVIVESAFNERLVKYISGQTLFV